MGAPKRAAPRARIVAGYILGEVLGEGTFGKVRIATKDGVRYAVKILDRVLIDTNEWAGKVRREIAIMRALAHPSIVRLHQVIRSPSRVYLVMELVTGGELYWKVQNEGALPEPQARAYFQQLVDGIAYCHSRGVYHRDLKPENLLLSEDESVLKVTDFGLSAVNPVPKADLLLKTPCGSPHYCAPEVRGKRTGPGYDGSKIDAWSCGVILFLLCTGWLPFHHDDPAKLQAQIDSGVVHFPDAIPRGAREICAGLLEKNPRKRATLDNVRAHPWFQHDYVPAKPLIPIPRAAPSPPMPPAPSPPHRLSIHRDDGPFSEPEICFPSHPRQSVPTRSVTKPPSKGRRRRLKSTLGVSTASAENGSASGRGGGGGDSAPTSQKSVPGLQMNRAPSLVLGDAPTSPRSAYDTKGTLASSSLSSSRSSFEAIPAGSKERTSPGAGGRRKPVVSFKLFAMSDVMKDCRNSEAERDRAPKTNSQKLFTFGVRMLSNLGPKWRSRG